MRTARRTKPITYCGEPFKPSSSPAGTSLRFIDVTATKTRRKLEGKKEKYIFFCVEIFIYIFISFFSEVELVEYRGDRWA